MRAIDPDMRSHLQTGATTLCRCWIVRRTDGVSFGFTDHDDDLILDGQVLRASSGMDASALKSATGLSVDNTSVTGALSDVAVTDAEIRAGRFDDAQVSQWLVNWAAPERRVLMFKGTFGEISRAEGGFEVELRGPAEALSVARGRNLLRRCDALLGDQRCGVDVADERFCAVTEVFAGSGARIEMLGMAQFAAGWFAGGTLIWESGTNAGLRGRIKADESDGRGMRVLWTWEETPLAVAPGDRARVVAGCDKLATTCRTKFENFLNFRGFPDIPGEDWVTAYPKDGEVHDGGSRAG